MPDVVALGKAVEKEKWGSGTTSNSMNIEVWLYSDIKGLEIFKHPVVSELGNLLYHLPLCR